MKVSALRSCAYFAALLPATSAFAEGEMACMLIKKYMDGPAAYISERGTKIKEGRWRGNSDFAGSKCEVLQDGDNHTVDCRISRDGDERAAKNLFEKISSDVKACVNTFPSGFFKSSYSEGTLASGTKSFSWDWEEKYKGRYFTLSLNRFHDSSENTDWVSMKFDLSRVY